MATPLPPNTAAFDADELCAATGGALFDVDAAALRVVGVCSDSRMVGPGHAFVALRGAAFDGHAFVDGARKAGAAIVVVERGKGVTGPRLEVDDTLVALGALAAFHLERLREASELRVIAIGGAVGKTTTKTLLAAGANAYFKSAAATIGNLNNRIGVPHTLLALTGDERAAVIECGTSERGEIAALGGIVRPDVALVLNVDVEHTEGLGTLDDVADEEASLFSFARAACVTWEGDERLVARLPSKRTLKFGASTSANVQLVARAFDRVTQDVRIAWNDETQIMRVTSKLLGEAAALNLTAALAGLLALATADGERVEPARLRAALDAMTAVEPVPGRFVPTRFGRDGLLFDDTYNANPKSVLAAIASAKEIADALGRPLAIVLGEMRELGAYAAESHDQVLRAALAATPRVCAFVGIEYVHAAARADADVPVFADSSAAIEMVNQIDDRDVVLVKGSRGVRMERFVEAVITT